MKNNLERQPDGSVLLFKGENLSCEKEYGSDIKNCCRLEGFLRNVVGPKCPRHVKEVLAPAVIRERRCHELPGWHCIARYPVIRKCRKWKKSFCCYQSNLGKIFQEIAHHQLGISWGSAEHPNCAPLDPKMFARLKLDDPHARALLRELVDSAQHNEQQYRDKVSVNISENNADVMHKVKAMQERIAEYYKNNGPDKS